MRLVGLLQSMIRAVSLAFSWFVSEKFAETSAGLGNATEGGRTAYENDFLPVVACHKVSICSASFVRGGRTETALGDL